MTKHKRTLKYAQSNSLNPPVSCRLLPREVVALDKLVAASGQDRSGFIASILRERLRLPVQAIPAVTADDASRALKPDVSCDRRPSTLKFMQWLRDPSSCKMQPFSTPVLVHTDVSLSNHMSRRTLAAGVNCRQPLHAKKYLVRMRKNTFAYSPFFCIILDLDGNVIDGLGRMTAMSQSCKAWPYYYVVAGRKDARLIQHHADTGMKRTLEQLIKDTFAAYKFDASEVHKVATCIRGFVNDFYRRSEEVEAEEAIDCLEKYAEDFKWAVRTLKATKDKSFVKGPLMGVMASLYRNNQKAATAFMEQLKLGPAGKSEPVRQLYTYLQRGSFNGTNRANWMYTVVSYCFKAFTHKQQVGLLNDAACARIHSAHYQNGAPASRAAAGAAN